MKGNIPSREINNKTLSFVAIVILLLVSCGGGGNSSPTTIVEVENNPDNAVCTVANSAVTDPVIYLASLDGVSSADILMANVNNPEAGSIRLNGQLTGGQSIESYALSPDNRCVIYISDERMTGRFELYSVSIDNPGEPARLNSALSVGKNVTGFTISPDGQEVIYRADQEQTDQHELFLANVSNPGFPIKINAELVSEGDVTSSDFMFSPDGSQILYVADQRINGRFELFLVDKSLPEVSSVVNAPFEDFVSLATGSSFSPDGNWIGYLADQDIDDVRELYVVDVANPGTSIKLNPPYSGEQDICSFEFRPDSQAVAYCADQDVNDKLELYAVLLSAPEFSDKLNSPIVDGGEVRADFSHSPDSAYIVYVADQDTVDTDELYRVDVNNPGVSEKLNAPLIIPGGDVDLYKIRPDAAAVAYVADQEMNSIFELYEVDITEPGISIKMSPSREGSDLVPFSYSVDGSRIIYVADQTISEKQELFRVDVLNPQVSTRLNARIEAGGQVIDFAIPVP